MKLASISLTGLTSDEEFANMVATAPNDCILLLEDVDHCLKVIEDSKGASSSTTPQSGHITLPGLLNVMDGLDMRDGTSKIEYQKEHWWTWLICLPSFHVVFFMTCNDNSVLPPVMKRRGRIDKEITLDYADKYQILMMFDRFFKNTHYGDESSWNRVRNNVAQAITPGEFSTAELQGLFLDYTFYLDRMANQTEDSFDALLDKIGEFKQEIQKTRHDWETHKNEKLDALRQKNQIKITTKETIHGKKKKKSDKAEANENAVSHSSSSSSISTSSPTTSVSSSSTATTMSLENDEKPDQQRNDWWLYPLGSLV